MSFGEPRPPQSNKEGEPQPSVAAVIFTGAPGKEKFLLVESADGFSPPGGRIEQGESDMEAIIREVREETGIVDTSLTISRWKEVTLGGYEVSLFVICLPDQLDDLEPQMKDEIKQVGWYSLEGMQLLITAGKIRNPAVPHIVTGGLRFYREG